MGLGKWILTHGFGSPGSTAKAVCRDYMRWKQELPGASKGELIAFTLAHRMKSGEKINLPILSLRKQQLLLEFADGDLARFIYGLVLAETPNGIQRVLEDPKLSASIIEVIQEQISKYAPGECGE